MIPRPARPHRGGSAAARRRNAGARHLPRHQLLGLALGARTFKLKFGHHGGNQPVKDLDSGKTLITSQNHGFAVEPQSLPPGCRVTQVNLNDGTVEAFAVDGKPVISAQYHPEAAPGPHDAGDIFDQFLQLRN